jgi:hypothetical protein
VTDIGQVSGRGSVTDIGQVSGRGSVTDIGQVSAAGSPTGGIMLTTLSAVCDLENARTISATRLLRGHRRMVSTIVHGKRAINYHACNRAGAAACYPCQVI